MVLQSWQSHCESSSSHWSNWISSYNVHIHHRYWSPRLARTIIFLSLTLSVCASVWLFVMDKLQIDFSLLFFDGRAIFWPSVLHDPLCKTLIFDFWFRPPNAQNLLPTFLWHVCMTARAICAHNATLPSRHPWLRSRHVRSAWGKSAIH